jgi:hypothetical protein
MPSPFLLLGLCHSLFFTIRWYWYCTRSHRKKGIAAARCCRSGLSVSRCITLWLKHSFLMGCCYVIRSLRCHWHNIIFLSCAICFVHDGTRWQLHWPSWLHFYLSESSRMSIGVEYVSWKPRTARAAEVGVIQGQKENVTFFATQKTCKLVLIPNCQFNDSSQFQSSHERAHKRARDVGLLVV